MVSSLYTFCTTPAASSSSSNGDLLLMSPAAGATTTKRGSHRRLFSNRLLQQRPVSSSVLTACCRHSSMEPDDDWRSFRARLVLNERDGDSSSDSVHPAAAGPAAAEKVVAGSSSSSRWAHLLAEPEKGCLLIATEKLDGSHIFERTVVLLLSAGGALGHAGVILNRPSLMSIRDAQPAVFAETDDTTAAADAFSGCSLFFGGPLEECFFLLLGSSAAGASSDVVGRTGLFEEVMPGLHYGTTETVGRAAELAKRGVVRPARDLRFFHGFCGWEPEQLRDEVRAGLWRVAACSPAVLGVTGVVEGGLWEELQGLVGKKRVW